MRCYAFFLTWIWTMEFSFRRLWQYKKNWENPRNIQHFLEHKDRRRTSNHAHLGPHLIQCSFKKTIMLIKMSHTTARKKFHQLYASIHLFLFYLRAKTTTKKKEQTKQKKKDEKIHHKKKQNN